MPENAVDEWPDGNDRRPSNTLLIFPVQACNNVFHWHRDKKSGLSRPTRFFNASVMSALYPLAAHNPRNPWWISNADALSIPMIAIVPSGTSRARYQVKGPLIWSGLFSYLISGSSRENSRSKGCSPLMIHANTHARDASDQSTRYDLSNHWKASRPNVSSARRRSLAMNSDISKHWQERVHQSQAGC